MRTLEIPVGGMHCGGCAQTLSLALRRLDGVRGAKADFDQARVQVRFDPQRVSEAHLRETIEACGFEPSGEQVS